MSTLPYMPFYPDNFLSDTAHLDAKEVGAYMLLLCYMWISHGWLVDNDAKLARLLRMKKAEWLKIRKNLEGYFTFMDGKFTQKRLLNEYAKAMKKVETNSKNGKLGAQKRKENKEQVLANASTKEHSNGFRHIGAALQPRLVE